MPAATPKSVTPYVLALTADPALGDELARLAAAAGAMLQVQASPPEVLDWLGCRLLVVGGDLAREVALAGHPRRPGVLLVTDDPDDAEVWQHAVGLGAEQVAVLPDSRDWLVEKLAAAVEPAGSALRRSGGERVGGGSRGDCGQRGTTGAARRPRPVGRRSRFDPGSR